MTRQLKGSLKTSCDAMKGEQLTKLKNLAKLHYFAGDAECELSRAELYMQDSLRSQGSATALKDYIARLARRIENLDTEIRQATEFADGGELVFCPFWTRRLNASQGAVVAMNAKN